MEGELRQHHPEADVRLGASCDWCRERFTLDEGLSRAVNEVFVRLYEKGLIYRGKYIINWCPRCKTALSDLEVVHKDQPGQLWYIKYPLVEDAEHIVVATTRPETMLGDTAVAVNPADKRYQEAHGKKVRCRSWIARFRLSRTSSADSAFGTGAVKMTPAHDFNDFEIGRRHNLPQIAVMDEPRQMNENARSLCGPRSLRRAQAHPRGSEDAGFSKRSSIPTAVGTCSRCETIVEPMLLDAVVREREADRRSRDRSGEGRPHAILPGELGEDLFQLDGKHPRLVHLAPALVGASHPRVALRCVQ